MSILRRDVRGFFLEGLARSFRPEKQDSARRLRDSESSSFTPPAQADDVRRADVAVDDVERCPVRAAERVRIAERRRHLLRDVRRDAGWAGATAGASALRDLGDVSPADASPSPGSRSRRRCRGSNTWTDVPGTGTGNAAMRASCTNMSASTGCARSARIRLTTNVRWNPSTPGITARNTSAIPPTPIDRAGHSAQTSPASSQDSTPHVPQSSTLERRGLKIRAAAIFRPRRRFAYGSQRELAGSHGTKRTLILLLRRHNRELWRRALPSVGRR